MKVKTTINWLETIRKLEVCKWKFQPRLDYIRIAKPDSKLYINLLNSLCHCKDIFSMIVVLFVHIRNTIIIHTYKCRYPYFVRIINHMNRCYEISPKCRVNYTYIAWTYNLIELFICENKYFKTIWWISSYEPLVSTKCGEYSI